MSAGYSVAHGGKCISHTAVKTGWRPPSQKEKSVVVGVCD